MEFYIAQGISVLTCIIVVVMMQFKDMKNILIGQIIANLLSGSTYFLLGGFSGAGISIIAVIQSIVMFLYNKKQKRPHLAVVISFIVLYVGCSALYYQSPIDILSALAAVCFAISIIQKKSSVARVWFAFNTFLWIFYDLFTLAYVNLIMHVALLISIFVAMLRNDIKKKN